MSHLIPTDLSCSENCQLTSARRAPFWIDVDSNKLMSWDPETMTWHDSLEQSAVRPIPRQIPGFAGAGGMLYVFGGFSQGMSSAGAGWVSLWMCGAG